MLACCHCSSSSSLTAAGLDGSDESLKVSVGGAEKDSVLWWLASAGGVAAIERGVLRLEVLQVDGCVVVPSTIARCAEASG